MARSHLTALQVRIPTKAANRDAIVAKLTDIDTALDAVMGDGVATPVETVSGAGAISIVKPFTLLSVTGTVAYTLANGTKKGQRKTIRCTVAASSPLGTVTPVSLSGGTSLLFNAVEDFIELVWNGTAWCIVKNNSVTVNP